MSQQGMKDQLMNLQLLVKFLDPELCNYLGNFLPFFTDFYHTCHTNQIKDIFEKNYSCNKAIKITVIITLLLATVTKPVHAIIHTTMSFSYISESHESSNMYFCFRWLLIMFKREFSFPDIMRLWEVFSQF